MCLYVRVVLTAASLFVYSVVCRRTPVFRPHRDVSTPQGTIRGYLTPTHAVFLGVPYARPPTPDRYKAPEPPPTWDGIFEASHKIKCPQAGEDGDENCLVINIFAPRHDTLLPVYVIIHDGGYNSGWGAHEPPARILKENYVVVTFNYRLGPLGFLCLGTEDALGNAGLKDQIAAIYWVNKNIEYFGGDPNEIILHGIKSAATSIQLILLSGLVDGLLNKVIVELESILSPMSITYDPISIAYQGATTLGYEGTADAEELYEFYNKTSRQVLIMLSDMFLPCAEDEVYTHSFLTFDPLERLKEGNYIKVPIIITYTDNYYIGNITEDILYQINDDMTGLLPINLVFNDEVTERQIGQIVKEFYFGNGIIKSSNVEQSYFDYNYDVYLEYPVVLFAMLYARSSPYMVYLLKFNFDSDQLTDDTSVWDSGTILENLYTELEKEDDYLEKLNTLWKNFIELGDPTPLATSLIPVIWKPVVVPPQNDRTAIAKIPTFNFGFKLTMTPSHKNQRLIFWENIYKKYYKSHHSTEDTSIDFNDSSEISDSIR